MFVREGWRSKRTMAENIYTMWIEMTSVSFIYLNRIWGIPPEASPVHSKAAAWPLGFFTRTKAHTFVGLLVVRVQYMYESTKIILSKVLSYFRTKVRKYFRTTLYFESTKVRKYKVPSYESTKVLFLLPMHCHTVALDCPMDIKYRVVHVCVPLVVVQRRQISHLKEERRPSTGPALASS